MIVKHLNSIEAPEIAAYMIDQLGSHIDEMVENEEAKKYYLDLVAACRQLYSSERAVSSWEKLQELI